jgi:hypothetical protein
MQTKKTKTAEEPIQPAFDLPVGLPTIQDFAGANTAAITGTASAVPGMPQFGFIAVEDPNQRVRTVLLFGF